MLYRSRYPAFVRVARGITRDEQAAHDAVHDAFVRAVRHRRRLRRESSLESWVWRTVVNEARRRAGREARADRRRALEAAPSSNGQPAHAEVRALLARLPERQRLALFLRYYADLDYAAIARVLDVAPGTVAATLNAAHARLRTLLEEVPTP